MKNEILAHCTDHATTPPGQRRPPGAEQKQAQGEIADDMPQLAQIVIPFDEAEPIDARQKMKQGIKQTVGMFGRAEIGGFQRDDSQPDQCRNPFFPGLRAGWNQAAAFRRERGEFAFMAGTLAAERDLAYSAA